MSLLPITASASGSKLIALTFDDGPAVYTQRLLDGLAERGVKVTFFLLGERVNYYPETVRRIYNEGHQIASHTYDHSALSTLSTDSIRRQVEQTEQAINGLLGTQDTFLVRTPYGDYTDRVRSAVDRPIILWSLDPADWQDRNAEIVRSRIVSRAFDGAIVLAHDIHSTTVDGALMAIDDLLEDGYEFVTVGELFRRRGVELNRGEIYYSCKPTGVDLGALKAPEAQCEPSYGGFRVTLSAQADIYCSIDGGEFRPYTQPLLLTGGQRLCAYAKGSGGSRSETVELTPEMPKTEALSVACEDGAVVITNPNADCDVRYTLNGSEPTAESAVYTAPLPCFDGELRFCLMGQGVRTATQRLFVTARGNLFADVAPNAWYFDEVDRAVSLQLFSGVGDRCFAPEDGLTRGMFVTVLYRLMRATGAEVSVTDAPTFSDVDAEQWYAEAVAWAAAKEIVLGYEDGTFRPDRMVTREEMCVLLARSSPDTFPKDGAPEFKDAERISDWAKEAVAQVSACGIILGMGDSSFAPAETATRAQAAAVLLRFYELVK